MGKLPITRLPEPAAGRWGQGLTAEKMKDCVWVRPELVARIQFLEWTGAMVGEKLGRSDELRQAPSAVPLYSPLPNVS